MSSVFNSMIHWQTDQLPTSTTLRSIDPTHSAGLISTLTSAYAAAQTETDPGSIRSLGHNIWGAEASLSIILAEAVLATATGSSDLARATDVMFNGTLSLMALTEDENLYGTALNKGANAFFAAIFGLIFVCYIGLTIWSRYKYFGLSFFFGSVLEFIGYLARALASDGAEDNENYFLIQIICLTIAPAFVMAGIYFSLAQVIVYQGRQYSILKPTWFTYIFVFCDVTSLVIQAVGGGMAATALETSKSTDTGTHVMVAGIGFQVFSMSLFLILFFDFVFRHLFAADREVKISLSNFFAVIFNTAKGREIRSVLEKHYNPKYANVRSRKWYPYTPLLIFLSSIFIYVRCIYRVVELAQGWTGFLITHEAYVLTLDAMMVLFTCATFIPFHLAFLFGKENKISLTAIRKKRDIEQDNFTKTSADVETVGDSIES